MFPLAPVRILSRWTLPYLVALAPTALSGQTMIINEVSNGASGVQEYIEFVVMPTAPVDPCAPPPCVDLRHWIFDDNNNYHGQGGAAAGALRFSSHALWSCVPVGTIVLVYNSNDPNPSVPAQDLSLTDGNCAIVIGVTTPGYFDQSSTTPNAALCADPGSWTAGGDWTRIGLRNEGDCARICTPDGCEVFSFCYGNISANATVHIAGGGAQRVWSFQGGDPYDQGEWTYGSVNAGLQTPGSANSAVNAAWIGQFNNNCTPAATTPVVAAATTTAGCACNGTATGSATGSVSPYDYAWFDDMWTSIGQDQAQATGLCDGLYRVIVTSATGCSDTATVQVTSLPGPDAGTDGTLDICTNGAHTDLFPQLGGTPDATGTWEPALASGTGVFDPYSDAAGTYTYRVPGANGCPDATASVTVTFLQLPALTSDLVSPLCTGDANGSINIEATGSGPFDFTWDDGPTSEDRSGLVAGTYILSVTDAQQCTDGLWITLLAPAPLVVDVSSQPSTCGLANGEVCAVASGGTGALTVQWDTPAPTTSGCAPAAAGNWNVTVTDVNSCTSTASVSVTTTGNPTQVAMVITDEQCADAGNGSIVVTMTPEPPTPLVWMMPDGPPMTGNTLTDLEAGTYSGQTTDASGCPVNVSATVSAPAPLVVTVASVTAESCAGACDGTVTLALAGGTPGYAIAIAGGSVNGTVVSALCAGTWSVQVQDAHGCAEAASAVVAAGAPGMDLTIDDVPPVCANNEAFLLTATPSGGSWSGTGIVDAASGLFDPAVAGAGMHVVTYSLTGPCARPAAAAVVVVPVPSAEFTVVQGMGTATNLVFTPVIGSTAIHTWSLDGAPMALTATWSFDPGEDRSAHEVCLELSEPAGCADEVCRTVQVVLSPDVHIPNAFTPNADGINDVFLPTIAGPWPTTSRLIVFDRWGKELFHTVGMQGWDGNTGGTPVPMGVYPWRFSYRDPLTGGTQELKGHVTLLR